MTTFAREEERRRRYRGRLVRTAWPAAALLAALLLMPLLLITALAAATVASPHPAADWQSPRPAADWLITPPAAAVTLTPTTIGGMPALRLANGIIERTFLTSPNWATWSLTVEGDDMLRSVQPEASFQLDNATTLLVGGVIGASPGQTNFAFKNTSEPLTSDPSRYQYVSHRTVPIAHRFDWTPGTRFSEQAPWPPLGLGLEVTFAPPKPAVPPEPCPSNCSASVCPPESLCCANPGGRLVRGPDPGEVYPYYGKPCRRQSDCAKCTLDGTCVCTPTPGQVPPMTGCCKKKVDATPTTATAAPAPLPTVTIVYEMYQGLPAMSKRVRINASQDDGAGCSMVRGLIVESLAFQETHIGRNNHFDTDWAWFQGDRVSLFSSYSRGPQYPCQTGRDGWVAGCSGGAGVFGLVKDPEYKTSYQFAWPSLLQAGFPLEHSCALRLPCIKQTAAEFCMEYGPCPAGATYQWEQSICGAGHSNGTSPEVFDSFTVYELFHHVRTSYHRSSTSSPTAVTILRLTSYVLRVTCELIRDRPMTTVRGAASPHAACTPSSRRR